MASAQVKSCLLLAGLYAEGKTTVTEPAPTRDHTERMLRGFGYSVESNGPVASLQSGGKLTATRIEVPADISSAAFFLVAASIAEGSELVLEHVGINPTRTGVIDILRLMGGDITLENQREVGGEPVATCACAAPSSRVSTSLKNWCRWPSTNSRCCSLPPPAPKGVPCCVVPKSCG
jgi:5-enolpyruvylshikimate-3-phosphate synthase